ncbi:hypothetical protein FACS189449_12990 [Alphaproteobacteria bacterium]|nr:hypothetical protein FACS189449_12990 [Alphaproteobacteria bacterium]
MQHIAILLNSRIFIYVPATNNAKHSNSQKSDNNVRSRLQYKRIAIVINRGYNNAPSGISFCLFSLSFRVAKIINPLDISAATSGAAENFTTIIRNNDSK